MSAFANITLPARQRLPFLILLAFAIAGILLAEWLPWPASLWLAPAVAAAFAFFCGWRTFAIFAVSAFAVIHLWQSRESPAARFAESLENRRIPALLTGLVATEPRVFTPDSCSFVLAVESLDAGKIPRPAPARLLVDWTGSPPAVGDRIQASGSLRNIPPPRNPGQFNFAGWSARQGVWSAFTVAREADASVIAKNAGFPVLRFALAARDAMKRNLTAGIDDSVVSELIVAMVLGEVSALPERIQQEFRGTGTYHLFSVSGLHVGMLAVILWFVLRSLRVPRRLAAIIIIPLLFFYALMTGLKPASIRAAIMGSIVLAGLMTSRRPVLLNNLCAAAFLILLTDTNQLFNAGFQLSFTVVAAILLFAGPLTTLLERPALPDPFLPAKLIPRWQRFLSDSGRKFAALAAVSLAAWIGSLPLTLGYFHLISFSALPCNLLAVPLSFGIMAVALLATATGAVSMGVAAIYNQTNWLLSKILLGIIHFFAALPGSYVFVGLPERPLPEAEIVVFDFGSGGASWIRAAQAAWLIDAGPVRSHDSVLLPFLHSRGRRQIDGLLVTHGDAGHVGAALELLDSCPPRQVATSPLPDRSPHRVKLLAELELRTFQTTIVRAGDALPIGLSARLHILYPSPGIERALADDKAVVARLDLGGLRMLFISDAGLFTENWLLAHARAELPADILVRGAPRDGPSGDPAFLDAINPRVVIATADDFPDSEKIDERFARELAARNIALFRQDHCGAVTVRIFSRSWKVSAFLGHREFVSSR